MNVVVAYDVNTETAKGRKRLRQVAKICEGFGQRVQMSVFECSLTRTQLQQLRGRLLDIIEPDLDSLRIYRLEGPREEAVEAFGRDTWIDLDDAIVF
jgi:CRISPR-associated protein Cas2